MSGPFKSQKKALLAAIDRYPPQSGLTPLKYAEADALAVDELLRRQGFETILLRGPAARRDDIEAALLRSAQESGGLFLFYFSGHGQVIRGSFHLHPVDSTRSGLRALAFDHCYRAWQSEFGYERVVAILDACRSELGGTKGPLPHTAEAARDIRAATQGQRQLEVFYGCSEGQVSFEDEALRHGVFTHCMLRAFDDHPDYLDTDLLAGATVDLMDEWSQHDPLQRRQTAQRYHVPSLKRRIVLLGDLEVAAWNSAREENTVVAYRAYLKDYLDGAHAADAQAAIQALREADAWARAKTENTLEACEKFLANWPKGRLAQEARDEAARLEAEEQEWQAARGADTGESYQTFLNRHADSRHAAGAKRRCAEIEADDQVWETARQACALEALAAYLAATNEDRHRKDALALKRDLEDDQAWAKTSQAKDLSQVRDYQVTFGANGRHLGEAAALRQTLEAEETVLAEAARRRRRARQLGVSASVSLCLVALFALFIYQSAHKAERQLRLKKAELEAESNPRSAEEARKQERSDLAAVMRLALEDERQGQDRLRRELTTKQQALRTALEEKRSLEARLQALTNPPKLLNAETATPELGDTRIVELGNGVTMELCGIPGGEFLMGSTKAEREWATGPEGQGKPEWLTNEGESPRLAHVRQGFWLGRTEVTVGQWKRFVAETSYRTDAETAGRALCFDWTSNRWGIVEGKSWRDPNYGFAVRDEHPVACVSWNDAMAFCKWLKEKLRAAGRLPTGMECRLPTEAEWEYACRGGRQGTRFWWGDAVADGKGRLNASSDDKCGYKIPDRTWSAKFPWSDGYAWVSPVDAFGAQGRNGFGLADMLGNVWEWCLDGADAKGAHEECWTGDTVQRVLRGGSFNNLPGVVRCAYRAGDPSTHAFACYGFRVCVGVGRFKTLATESNDLSQEIRENRSLAPNSIFNEFGTNRIMTRFQASRTGLFGLDVNRRRATETVLVSDGTNTSALCHVEDTPLIFWTPGTDWEGLTGTLGRQTALISIKSMSFYLLDPRVVLIPVTDAQVRELGCKVYRIMSDPYKFQDAVVIGAKESYYGEFKFQVDLTTPQYVKMDRNLITGSFGKFNPSRGDLVFSKTGELLGVMANSTYCVTLRNFNSVTNIQFGPDMRSQHTGELLSRMHGLITNLPTKLQ